MTLMMMAWIAYSTACFGVLYFHENCQYSRELVYLSSSLLEDKYYVYHFQRK